MKKCPHCGRYNGTNNSKCSACNNFFAVQENTRNNRPKINGRKLALIVTAIALFIGVVIFIFSIPTMYAEMKKSDEEKAIDKKLTEEEKRDLEVYIARADHFLRREEYVKSYDEIQKALKINKESTAAKELKEEVWPNVDDPQKDADAAIISATKQKVKEYYFEQAIQDLEKIQSILTYSKKENPYYSEAQQKINYVLLKKGEYLESVGKKTVAISAYNRMNADYKYYEDGQYNIERINTPPKEESPGLFADLVGAFTKTEEEKQAEKIQREAEEKAAFQEKIQKAQSVNYDELERAPGRFKDSPIYVEGSVYDIQEINGKTLMSIIAYDDYGEKHSVVAVYHNKTAIHENDYVVMYADVWGGYGQAQQKISNYIDDGYYIYYDRESTFYQAPVVEIFQITANGVTYR